ncbi:type II toxin-antitoxin system VapC family toxin [Acaryochloris sp. CCMEE 5410]|uniref:type II toxin-antitoxin system VapC family toxin n=1 Tax=Acaryochloris sp. CCMEE 5410 TaxID=310037 RepID=UPI000248502D|nr:PIN domain-containing protein [Acaryochloris sp. CCMEE 5410]KAI9130093.1 type II toxin-antitoxin system VapC family toxin [Acaryochloris sp. CCMEE 5410]
MVTKLFVDTWGWLTLHDRREDQHATVVKQYQTIRAAGGQVYTTDYVLDETFTLFFKRLRAEQAKASMELLLDAFEQDSFYLERITIERFAATRTLRLKYLDKPRISFTDLTSMVVMQELGIVTVLTGDAHFLQVGMNFQVVPTNTLLS